MTHRMPPGDHRLVHLEHVGIVELAGGVVKWTGTANLQSTGGVSSADVESATCDLQLAALGRARLAAVIESDGCRSAFGLRLTAHSSALFDRGFRSQQLRVVSRGR